MREATEQAIVARSRIVDGPVAEADTVVAGLHAKGRAITLTATGPRRWHHIRDQADALTNNLAHHVSPGTPKVPIAFVGGGAFHDDHEPTGRWRAFPSTAFWLPEVQTRRVGDTWVETRIEATATASEAPRKTRPPSTATPMSRRHWHAAVQDAMRAITHGDVAKVVLARDEVSEPRDVGVVWQRIGNGFRITPRPGHCFMGDTPERLAVVAGATVATHALAGTAPRSQDPAEDQRLGDGLLASQKDILEHELVASYIRERLGSLGASTRRSGRRLLRLGNVQHLETPIEADIPEGTHALDVVAALHPTPAVGGSPQRASIALMRRLETFPRGWYAGPIGWFDTTGNGEFHVALRCALLTPDQTCLFAGAGIVAGSDPDDEWDETEAKLEAMRSVL